MTTDWSADLDEFVEGGDLPPDDEPLPPIEGQEQADIWLRRLARLNGESEQIGALAAVEIDRLTAWRDDRLSGVVRDAQRIERHVELWARATLTGKRKSLSLPWGTPSLRQRSRSVSVTDDAAFEQWALANDRELLLLPGKTRQPDKRAVAESFEVGPLIEADDDTKRHSLVTREGEQVPGVVIAVGARDSFSIVKPKAVDE